MEEVARKARKAECQAGRLPFFLFPSVRRSDSEQNRMFSHSQDRGISCISHFQTWDFFFWRRFRRLPLRFCEGKTHLPPPVIGSRPWPTVDGKAVNMS